jgi:hypothetical protein
LKGRVKNHLISINELRRLIDTIDSGIVAQWNLLVDSYTNFKSSVMLRSDPLSSKVDNFEKWGIDNCLEAI